MSLKTDDKRSKFGNISVRQKHFVRQYRDFAEKFTIKNKLPEDRNETKNRLNIYSYSLDTMFKMMFQQLGQVAVTWMVSTISIPIITFIIARPRKITYLVIFQTSYSSTARCKCQAQREMLISSNLLHLNHSSLTETYRGVVICHCVYSIWRWSIHY